MIENRRLPLLFFTPKLQAYRGPCFQLLENTSSDHRITALGNIHNYPEGTHNVLFSSEISSDRLFRAKINPEQTEFYWYLPFKIGHGFQETINPSIPVKMLRISLKRFVYYALITSMPLKSRETTGNSRHHYQLSRSHSL